jgi:hypothetical protein
MVDYTKIYHGTPYLDEIIKSGGFTSNKSFWSPDRSTAEQYAKHNKFFRGTPWGKITGNIIEGSIPSSQANALTRRGLTGTRELALSGDEASKLYRSGIANVKGVPSWMRTFGRYIPKLLKRAPGIGFASDALFGTTYTADTARDINNLLGVNTSPNVNQGGGGQGRGSSTGPGQTRKPVGMGSAPRGPDLRNRANGGIISLWQR